MPLTITRKLLGELIYESCLYKAAVIEAMNNAVIDRLNQTSVPCEGVGAAPKGQTHKDSSVVPQREAAPREDNYEG